MQCIVRKEIRAYAHDFASSTFPLQHNKEATNTTEHYRH